MLGRPLYALALAAACLGCSFDKTALNLGEPDGGWPVDAAGDATLPDGGAGADSGSCVEGRLECSGDVLRRCVSGRFQTAETCALGCKVDEARCYTFTAANVTDGTLALGDADLIVDANATLDVSAGTLNGAALPTGVITASQDQSSGYPALFVVRVRDFMVAPGVRLLVRGARALAILASGEISVDGMIDMSAEGKTGGPGGYDGGGRGSTGGGPGGGSGGVNGGSLGTDSTGGGGGGGGGPGGKGGVGGAMGPVSGGLAGSLSLRPLCGGSGGGGGSAAGDDAGGGGGALQLSAAVSIVVTGSIVAVGDGGGAGLAKTTDFGGGSGGGGGGSVLLEAPEVTVGGIVALGGGGGGGGGCTPDLITLLDGAPGEGGKVSGAVALGGGPGCPEEGGGGAGGALGSPAQDGKTGALNGGGGGGGPGRLHVASRSGHATLTGTLSPNVASGLVVESTLTRK